MRFADLLFKTVIHELFFSNKNGVTNTLTAATTIRAATANKGRNHVLNERDSMNPDKIL